MCQWFDSAFGQKAIIMNKTTKNLLLKIKNSSAVKLNECRLKYSTKIINLLELLYEQGFIQSFDTMNSKSTVCVYLRYLDNKSVFEHLKIFSSKLSSRNITLLELSRISNKRFILFLTTNQGFATSFKCKSDHFSGKTMFLC